MSSCQIVPITNLIFGVLGGSKMQTDTDLIRQIRDYIKLKPFLTAYDIVEYFNSIGIPKEKVLYVLREIND